MAHAQIKNQHELKARALKQNLISSQLIFYDIVNLGGIYLFILEDWQYSLAQPKCSHGHINFSISVNTEHRHLIDTSIMCALY